MEVKTDTYKTLGEFQITGRGKVITLSAKENGITHLKLLGNKLIYKGTEYEIKGVEAMRTWNDSFADSIAFLIKPITVL